VPGAGSCSEVRAQQEDAAAAGRASSSMARTRSTATDIAGLLAWIAVGGSGMAWRGASATRARSPRRRRGQDGSDPVSAACPRGEPLFSGYQLQLARVKIFRSLLLDRHIHDCIVHQRATSQIIHLFS
jgi:hypothetical protein